MGLAANNLDNPDYNQGFALRKVVTTGTKDTCLFLPLWQIFGWHKDIDAAFIHTYQFTREPATNSIWRANGVAVGVYHLTHQSVNAQSYTQPTYSSRARAEAGKWCDAPAALWAIRIYRNSYQENETSVALRVTTNSSERLPNYIFVAFQLQAKYGDQEKNPVVFAQKLG